MAGSRGRAEVPSGDTLEVGTAPAEVRYWCRMETEMEEEGAQGFGFVEFETPMGY